MAIAEYFGTVIGILQIAVFVMLIREIFGIGYQTASKAASKTKEAAKKSANTWDKFQNWREQRKQEKKTKQAAEDALDTFEDEINAESNVWQDVRSSLKNIRNNLKGDPTKNWADIVNEIKHLNEVLKGKGDNPSLQSLAKNNERLSGELITSLKALENEVPNVVKAIETDKKALETLLEGEGPNGNEAYEFNLNEPNGSGNIQVHGLNELVSTLSSGSDPGDFFEEEEAVGKYFGEWYGDQFSQYADDVSHVSDPAELLKRLQGHREAAQNEIARLNDGIETVSDLDTNEQKLETLMGDIEKHAKKYRNHFDELEFHLDDMLKVGKQISERVKASKDVPERQMERLKKSLNELTNTFESLHKLHKSIEEKAGHIRDQFEQYQEIINGLEGRIARYFQEVIADMDNLNISR
jgi:chromosome segregation ATPase